MVSLLLAHGHVEASSYTPGLIYEEVALLRIWMERLEATRATLLQAAVGGLLDKEAGKTFREIANRMMEG